LSGGPGGDDMRGGAGRDAADYSEAGGNVTVVLDDAPNDGQGGEGDNVRSDVEDVRGGGVQDTFTGSRDGNDLDGGAGEDYVDGRGGRDELRGGTSRDVVRARDGNRDLVDCGRSADFAIVDRRDVVRNCERKDAGRARARLGRDVVVRPKGVRLQFGLPRSRRTVPLLDTIGVPVATTLDARGGSLRLTSARSRGKSQSATFSSGLFTVLQARSRRPITELRLKGGDFRRCGTRAGRGRAGAAQRRRRTIRRLRGNARGRFRTRGRYSAATVRGTDYTVEDRCDGTLTRVRRGVVLVRDFRRRRTVTVRAGRSYLARARR
ncbi:MAG TPA: calcium-binding protein, partial [Solirubrobacteraceae bacterium]|nr:calcium-binding protein [Solirubrobacteraceae bacterium]